MTNQIGQWYDEACSFTRTWFYASLLVQCICVYFRGVNSVLLLRRKIGALPVFAFILVVFGGLMVIGIVVLLGLVRIVLQPKPFYGS